MSNPKVYVIKAHKSGPKIYLIRYQLIRRDEIPQINQIEGTIN